MLALIQDSPGYRNSYSMETGENLKKMMSVACDIKFGKDKWSKHSQNHRDSWCILI